MSLIGEVVMNSVADIEGKSMGKLDVEAEKADINSVLEGGFSAQGARCGDDPGVTV